MDGTNISLQMKHFIVYFFLHKLFFLYCVFYRNFSFLMSIEKEFTKMFRTGRIQTANAYSLSNNFTPTIRSSMHYHNIHMNELRQEEHVQALRIKVDTIRTIMGRNINMILERGTKLDTLLSKSDTLNKDAQVFKKKSKQAKHLMQRKYYFWYAIFAFILIVFLYMTVVSTCGIRFEYCRASSHSSNNSSTNSNNYNTNNADGGETDQGDNGGN
jgi:Synaptobrevin